jgi:pimeloyl-ACP methyl ester carboxylesterase
MSSGRRASSSAIALPMPRLEPVTSAVSPLKSMATEGLLHHIRTGTGEPIILIHPLGAALVVWEPVIELLASERDTIALDMPGFGASPPLADGEQPTPQALAAAIARFMDTLEIERAHVVGCSLGGWVALELAKAGRALSVTALNSAGLWRRPLGERSGPDSRRLARALSPALNALVRTERGRGLLLRGTVGHPERVPAAAAARLVRAYGRAASYDGANTAMRAAIFDGAEEIEVPVTLGWGDLDRLVRPPKRLPRGWRSEVLHGCGHVPTWDDPEQVARLILRASS